MAEKQQPKPQLSELSRDEIAAIGNEGVRQALEDSRKAGLKPPVRENVFPKRVTAAE